MRQPAVATPPAGTADSRSEDGPISLSDPIVTLTLVTVVLWLAVIGWKLGRKDQPKGPGRGGRRRGGYGPDDYYGDGYYTDGREYDEPPRKPAKPPKVPAQSRGSVTAEVSINPGKCMRFAFCEHEAPEIFKLTGERIDYKTTVPAEHIAAVDMAVKVCPARAIKMKLPGSKPYLPQPHVDDTQRRPVRR